MNSFDISSPIISNFNYIVESSKSKRPLTQDQKITEFQKILLEQVFAQSFIPDQDNVFSGDPDENEENVFTSGKKDEIDLQNQLSRKALVENLAKLDPMGLKFVFGKKKPFGKYPA